MITDLKVHAEKYLKGKTESIIQGIWNIDCLFQPNVQERIFDCNFLIAQTIHNGCAYCFRRSNTDELRNYIGKDYFKVNITYNALTVAILDSMYASAKQQPIKTYNLNSDSLSKLEKRSDIIVEEVLRFKKEKENLRIVNIGTVGNIIHKLGKIPDIIVQSTDYDPHIVGKNMQGVTVLHGDYSVDAIRNSDVAIITGMALLSKNIKEIIKTANETGCEIILFAETGANLIDFYFSKGINTVISEPFPFYIFHGHSQIDVYRNE
jgi:hypothetical protein